MTITEFLLARIAEDESLARAAIAPDQMHPYGDTTIPPTPVEGWGNEVRGYLGGTWGDHCAQHDPTRVLRECAAMRAIIGSHESCTSMTNKEQELGVKLVGVGMMKGLHLAVQSLAVVYSDHPDYQQDWAL